MQCLKKRLLSCCMLHHKLSSVFTKQIGGREKRYLILKVVISENSFPSLYYQRFAFTVFWMVRTPVVLCSIVTSFVFSSSKPILQQLLCASKPWGIGVRGS